MSVYTRNGDEGFTELFNGTRVSKNDCTIEFLGTLDEFTSHLGITRAETNLNEIKDIIYSVQNELIKIMAYIAGNEALIDMTAKVKQVEEWIDSFEKKYLKVKEFVIPGNSKTSAELDVARTVARRAERVLGDLTSKREIDTGLKKYINRISDLLYVMARYYDFYDLIDKKINEVLKTGIPKVENKEILTLSRAVKLIDIVQARAVEIGINVVTAVAGDKGNIIAVHHMDDALPGGYDIAVNKAFTSASLKMSTEYIGKLAIPSGPLYGIQNTNGGRIVVFGGGCPLKNNNTVIGGIGVSGGTAEQDIELANYAENIFREVI
jgi:ATP:cob(I)alamin adenosyltransferase